MTDDQLEAATQLNARRAQLKIFLEESRLNARLEDHLLDALREVRAARSKADRFIAAIVGEGERKPYTPEQWRLLLDGVREDVASACARASL